MSKQIQPKLENIRRLEKFYKYLNYEISSSLLYLGSWFIPMFTSLLFFAAIVFTPFMLFVLYKEGKNGWIIFFSIIVILPVVILISFYSSLLMVVLVPFYLFCFILRMEAKGWVTEMRARNDLALQKIRKANEGTALEDYTIMR